MKTDGQVCAGFYIPSLLSDIKFFFFLFLKHFNGVTFEVEASECDNFVGPSDNLVHAICGADRPFSSAQIKGFHHYVTKVFSSARKSLENHTAVHWL